MLTYFRSAAKLSLAQVSDDDADGQRYADHHSQLEGIIHLRYTFKERMTFIEKYKIGKDRESSRRLTIP
jgi:hypothetical protein